MRILVVDPQAEARAAIARWLYEFFAHVEIESAASAAAALATLATRMPDLVITAHSPPSLDGIELASLVKSRPSSPLVVVLASGQAGGVDLWLEKRHLHALLLDFLQHRFPQTWAKSVAERRAAVRPRTRAMKRLAF